MISAITPEQILEAGILAEPTAEDCAWIEAGLAWISTHTSLDARSIPPERLPGGAKIFLRKYRELIEQFGISSESIEGLSQSFDVDALDKMVEALADTLLAEYVGPAVTFTPKAEPYRYLPPYHHTGRGFDFS